MVVLLLIVTFSADVVTGREEHRPQPQHQLTQEPCFRVLKDLHTFERVQVNVDGNLGLQLV